MEHPTPNNAPQEFGPVVGAIIIVGLFVVGGVYFFVMQEQKIKSSESATSTTPEASTTLPQTN